MKETWTYGGLTAVILLLSTGLSLQAAMPVPPAQPAATPNGNPPIELAPHRAIYDMTLVKAAASANVGEVRGRMVFDFSGSVCEGYTLNMRLVTEIVDRDGKSSVNDLRSTTWEHAKGEKFRFNSSQYLNQRLGEQVMGVASRGKEAGVNIAIDKPKKRQVKMPAGALFPTQHSIAILDAAQAGRSIVQADIYDGTEKGDKYYETTTFIGKALQPGSGSEAIKSVPNAEKLDGLVSWPVTISYYESPTGKKMRDEGTPSYELSFRLYANGVSRRLQIDYGTFSIAGELSRIDFSEPAKCTDANGGGHGNGKSEKKP
jgi:hypothetical protein